MLCCGFLGESSQTLLAPQPVADLAADPVHLCQGGECDGNWCRAYTTNHDGQSADHQRYLQALASGVCCKGQPCTAAVAADQELIAVSILPLKSLGFIFDAELHGHALFVGTS